MIQPIAERSSVYSMAQCPACWFMPATLMQGLTGIAPACAATLALLRHCQVTGAETDRVDLGQGMLEPAYRRGTFGHTRRPFVRTGLCFGPRPALSVPAKHPPAPPDRGLLLPVARRRHAPLVPAGAADLHRTGPTAVTPSGRITSALGATLATGSVYHAPLRSCCHRQP